MQLTHLSLLKITGDDAESFLQGQLTNDVQKLNEQWQFSGYCSPKGRLIALLQLWKKDDVFFALIDSSIVDTAIKRLRMYVMRSNVTIEPIEHASITGFLSKGFTSKQRVKTSGNSTASYSVEVDSTGQVMMLSVANRTLCVNIGGSSDQHSQIDNDQAAILNQQQLTTEQWLQHDIVDGLAQVTQNSSELFIPQMLNLDIVNGISFKKGCYTGQEIVARMHYLGKLKQRMFVCDFTNKEALTDESANAGDKIYADAELSKSIGNVVTMVADHCELLAVLRLDAAANEHTFFMAGGTQLSLSAEQPYDFPQQT